LADEIAMKVNVIKCRKGIIASSLLYLSAYSLTSMTKQGIEEKTKQSTVMDNFLPVFFLLDVLIIVTLFLLKRKKPKAKIN